ncbi:MAG: hypothetical protein ACJ718_12075, partial [Nitrososphaeraceae archaeon]
RTLAFSFELTIRLMILSNKIIIIQNKLHLGIQLRIYLLGCNVFVRTISNIIIIYELEGLKCICIQGTDRVWTI